MCAGVLVCNAFIIPLGSKPWKTGDIVSELNFLLCMRKGGFTVTVG